MINREKGIIGRAENISFPELEIADIPARIDTGARTSAVWASRIKVDNSGKLNFYLFDESSQYFVNHRITTGSFSEIIVTSSMGMMERRYKVKLLVRLDNRKIRASFTLSNRSQQVYPVLIGRNVLRGKFIVDVKVGNPLTEKEKARDLALEELLKQDKELNK
jgi:hypothetical protein